MAEKKLHFSQITPGDLIAVKGEGDTIIGTVDYPTPVSLDTGETMEVTFTRNVVSPTYRKMLLHPEKHVVIRIA